MSEREIFVCDCHSLEHIVAFWYDEEGNELYIYPKLTTYRNIFKRIWVAIKYVFGYTSRYGEFDEVIIPQSKHDKLIKILTNGRTEYSQDSKRRNGCRCQETAGSE